MALHTETKENGPVIDDVSQKVHEIHEACRRQDVDSIRALASSEGGLIDDEARRAACMRYTMSCSDISC